MRFASLTVVVFAWLIATGSPAEAQLWKPTKKPTVTTTAAPTRPAAAKPARKKVRRAARPTRPARPAARAVVRDDAPRARGGADALPEFDNSPRIVVERPGRGER